MASVSRLGLSVGRFGSEGGLSEAEAFAAVALAADAGVRLIDCPAERLGAEQVLGQVLPREPAFQVSLHAADVEGGPDAVSRRLSGSLMRLKRDRVAALLAPARAIRADGGPELWAGLLRLKDEGVVGAVGVAACVCDEPIALAHRFRPDFMQLPFGLLDRRLLASGALDAIAGAGVEVRLRLLSRAHGLHDAGPAPLSSGAARLRLRLAETGLEPLQAELGFALSRPQASQVVAGVGALADLRVLLDAAASPVPALDWDAFDRGAAAEAPCPADALRCRAA